MTIQNNFFVKNICQKNLTTKLVKKLLKKKLKINFFLQKILKNGYLEDKANGESKKIRNSKKKLRSGLKKDSSRLFLTQLGSFSKQASILRYRSPIIQLLRFDFSYPLM